MIRMAERDIKKYIKPSNKEIENIIPFMDVLFLWFCSMCECKWTCGCADIFVCVCVCVLPTGSVQMLFLCLSSLTGLWLWWILYYASIQQCARLHLKPHSTPTSPLYLQHL